MCTFPAVCTVLWLHQRKECGWFRCSRASLGSLGMDSMRMHSLHGVLQHRYRLTLSQEQMFGPNTSIAWIVANRVPLSQQELNGDGSVTVPTAPFVSLSPEPEGPGVCGHRRRGVECVCVCVRSSPTGHDGRQACPPRNGILSTKLPLLSVFLLRPWVAFAAFLLECRSVPKKLHVLNVETYTISCWCDHGTLRAALLFGFPFSINSGTCALVETVVVIVVVASAFLQICHHL
jgi:hypothetical protein